MALPDRKFLSEFAVNLCSARWLLLSPDQLGEGRPMTPEEQEISSNCHIYIVGRRPRFSIDPTSFEFDGEFLSGSLTYKKAGSAAARPFRQRSALPNGAVEFRVSSYPHREIHSVDATGDVLTVFPAWYLSLNGSVDEQAAYQFKVLYVGQAFAEGNRNAIDRLESHSTLQRILAKSGYDFPDDEVMLFAFEYAPFRLLITMDGMAKNSAIISFTHHGNLR